MARIHTIPSEDQSVIVVVYTLSDGGIIHIHQSDSERGIQDEEKDIQLRAIETACKLTGRSRSDVFSIRIKENELRPAVAYVVDVERKVLSVKDDSNVSREKKKTKE